MESISKLQESIKNKEIPEIPKAQKEVYEKHLNNENFQKVLEKIQVKEINLYILCKLLYSCMITADFYATYDYMSEKEVKFEIDRNDRLFKNYEASDLIKNIRKYENNEIALEGINQLRSDIFLEAERNLKQNLDKNIFYLEAPTGAGKTNMAINLARILYKTEKKITSIYYIFPFNNIIEQTDSTFQRYFHNKLLISASHTTVHRSQSSFFFSGHAVPEPSFFSKSGCSHRPRGFGRNDGCSSFWR